MSDNSIDLGEQLLFPLPQQGAGAAIGRRTPSYQAKTNNSNSCSSSTCTSVVPNDNINIHASNTIVNNSNWKTITTKIGHVCEEFKCLHNNFSGILYVGPIGVYVDVVAWYSSYCCCCFFPLTASSFSLLPSSSSGVLFLGKFLLFEWTVIIRWQDVLKVKRKQIGTHAKRDLIRLETRGGSNGNTNPHVYDFEQFFDARKALQRLLTVHNDSYSTIDSRSMSTSSSRTNANRNSGLILGGDSHFRRRNSEPQQVISTLFNFDDLPLVAMDNTVTNSNTNGADDAHGNSMRDLKAQYHMMTSSSSDGGGAGVDINSSGQRSVTPTLMSAATAPVATTMSHRRSILKRNDTSITTIGDESERSSCENNNIVVFMNDNNNTEEVVGDDDDNSTVLLRDEWDMVYKSFIGNKQQEIAIDNQELVCTVGRLTSSSNDEENNKNKNGLDYFMKNFVNDDAHYPISDFMIHTVGDTKVQTTNWIPRQDDSDNDTNNNTTTNVAAPPGVSCFTRTIEYTHPVNAPMAPPEARARKEQTLKQYGKYGIIISTKTFVSDVPMTDCFYVIDTVCIETKVALEKRIISTTATKASLSPSLILNVRFDVVFVKSTMFRSLITRTTKSEIHQFMKKYAKYIITKLQELENHKSIANSVKQVRSVENTSKNQTSQAAVVAESAAAAATTIHHVENTNDNNNPWSLLLSWRILLLVSLALISIWSWRIMLIILLALIVQLQIEMLKEMKSIRLELQQQQQQQQS